MVCFLSRLLTLGKLNFNTKIPISSVEVEIMVIYVLPQCGPLAGSQERWDFGSGQLSGGKQFHCLPYIRAALCRISWANGFASAVVFARQTRKVIVLIVAVRVGAAGSLLIIN